MHIAHIQLVEYLLEQYPADQIVVMPAFVPPHKTESELIPFRHRYSMLNIAFGPLMKKHPNLRISRLEKKLPTPNYTYKTLDYLSSNCRNANWNLVMGYDMYLSLPRWKNAHEIMKKYPIVVFARQEPIETPPVFEELGFPPQFLKNPLWPVSSTEIREAVRSDKPGSEAVLPNFLPESVIEYMARNQLLKK